MNSVTFRHQRTLWVFVTRTCKSAGNHLGGLLVNSCDQGPASCFFSFVWPRFGEGWGELSPTQASGGNRVLAVAVLQRQKEVLLSLVTWHFLTLSFAQEASLCESHFLGVPWCQLASHNLHPLAGRSRPFPPPPNTVPSLGLILWPAWSCCSCFPSPFHWVMMEYRGGWSKSRFLPRQVNLCKNSLEQ